MDAFLNAEQRISNIIRFFAQNTECCGKIKLFKLLYLLDFQHVRETGKPVTGLDYQAWKFGPVPMQIMERWDDPDTEIADGCSVTSEPVFDYVRQTVKVDPACQFNELLFSRRELRIMRDLAEKYRRTTSPRMIDVTHQENGAWDKVWQNGRGKYNSIPYDLAISEDNPNRVVLREIQGEFRARQAALQALSDGLHV